MSERKIPPKLFHLHYYDFPVDQVRHWIELQEGRPFSTEEARKAVDVDASRVLGRLSRKGEIECLGRSMYRQRESFMFVDFEAADRRHKGFDEGLQKILDAELKKRGREMDERKITDEKIVAALAKTNPVTTINYTEFEFLQCVLCKANNADSVVRGDWIEVVHEEDCPYRMSNPREI